MKPYGVKRNLSAWDDYIKNGEARSARKQARRKKMMHRVARRTAKYLLKINSPLL